jgi:hypothetical protein
MLLLRSDKLHNGIGNVDNASVSKLGDEFLGVGKFLWLGSVRFPTEPLLVVLADDGMRM